MSVVEIINYFIFYSLFISFDYQDSNEKFTKQIYFLFCLIN